jgi:hypothetical protein
LGFQLHKELQEKHHVTIGYSTVHLGKELARNELFGTWEESFDYLFNFAAEIQLSGTLHSHSAAIHS